MTSIDIGIHLWRVLSSAIELVQSTFDHPDLAPKIQDLRDAAEALKGDIGGGD